VDINSVELTRVKKSEIGSAYNSEEMGYYSSFERHIHVATILIESGSCYREGYYTLLVAIECYLKDIFCTLRFLTIGSFNQATQGKLKDFPGAIREKMKDSIRARNFGHDLKKVAECLRDFCFNLRDGGADAIQYDIFLSQLPPERDWIEKRYESLIGSDADFKDKVQVLKSTLQKLQEGPFKEFK
jgi:hypothetical protein